MVGHQHNLPSILYVFSHILARSSHPLTTHRTDLFFMTDLRASRGRTQSAGPRPYSARVLQQAAALAIHLGHILDDGLPPRQRIPGLLRVEHTKLYHSVHKHPHLLWSLDRLGPVHAHTLLARRRNGLCHGAFD